MNEESSKWEKLDRSHLYILVFVKFFQSFKIVLMVLFLVGVIYGFAHSLAIIIGRWNELSLIEVWLAVGLVGCLLLFWPILSIIPHIWKNIDFSNYDYYRLLH